jgi:magnesium transporter
MTDEPERAEDGFLAELYLQRHPQEAVSVLERLDVQSIVTLIETLSDVQAAEVLARLRPEVSMSCLRQLSVERGAVYLAHMPRGAGVAALRRMRPERRDALLRACSAATRFQIEMVLRQPAHRVGAWIDASPASVEQGSTAQIARDRLSRQEPPASELYTVDPARRLLGVVPVSRLFALDPSDIVDSVAAPPPSVLRANLSIENAIEDPAWENVDRLPVVDRDGKLVGSIRHGTLRRAVAARLPAQPEQEVEDYIGLVNAMYVCMADALTTSIAKSASKAPRRGAEGARP